MQCTTRTCIDCGSPATRSVIHEIQSVFRMEQVLFSCGAIMTHSYRSNGKLGGISHAGCLAERHGVTPAAAMDH